MKDIIKENILFEQVAKPEIPKEARIYLQRLYHDDSSKLKDILNLSLPWSSLY
jgi:hypothetical protein